VIDRAIIIPDVLSPSECQAVLRSVDVLSWSPAGVLNGEGATMEDRGARISEVAWLPGDHFLTRLLVRQMFAVNDEYFRFVLDGYENVQLTKYGPGGFYRFHIDTFNPGGTAANEWNPQWRIRKLSGSLLLSDPRDFIGGEILVHGSYGRKVEEVFVRGYGYGQGTLVVFPGVMLHSVTPVLAGTRYSAVIWMTGPLWR
jgi:predicted 2-oxoglutarate/Fe(II)-dependent dioxygenase YbiX